MKKQIMLSILVILLLTACKKGDFVVFGESVSVEEKEVQEAIETPTEKAIKETVSKDCYLADLEGNKIEMEMQFNADDITGTLTYAFIGKDINSGTFRGKLANNVLIADYTFQSEGITGVRQIAFKLQDDQFVEGYGKMIDNGTKFKDPKKLEFNSNMPLKKVDCP